jgi:hypothetical protein
MSSTQSAPQTAPRTVHISSKSDDSTSPSCRRLAWGDASCDPRHPFALHCLNACALASDPLHVWCLGWRGASARERHSRQRDCGGDRHRGLRNRCHRHGHRHTRLAASMRTDSILRCHPDGQSQAGQASPPPRPPIEEAQATRHLAFHQARADAPGAGEVAPVPATMRGRDPVPVAALPATAAVSARRVVPGGPLRAPLRHEHHHNRRPAAARVPTSLFGRHSHRHRTAVPAALHSERHQHAHQCRRTLVSAALPSTLHDRPGLSDDRLSSRPAVTAASMPRLQQGQPVLPVSRAAAQRLAESSVRARTHRHDGAHAPVAAICWAAAWWRWATDRARSGRAPRGHRGLGCAAATAVDPLAWQRTSWRHDDPGEALCATPRSQASTVMDSQPASRVCNLLRTSTRAWVVGQFGSSGALMALRHERSASHAANTRSRGCPITKQAGRVLST